MAAAGGVGKGREGTTGSSFVAVQQWVHDLDRFESFGSRGQDEVIGRRRSDNEEMEDAPEAAHVKRTEQEAFDPPAYLVRRSMAWADEAREGLVFVSFSASLDPFETLLRRMTGATTGLADHLFRFTRPVTGAYFWCPPVREGRLESPLHPLTERGIAGRPRSSLDTRPTLELQPVRPGCRSV